TIFWMDEIIASPQSEATSKLVPAFVSPNASATPVAESTALKSRRAVSARQTGALVFLLVVFILMLIGPFLVGRIVYETKFNELKAGYDVATGTLAQLKPQLNDLELASRLVAKRMEPSVVSIVRPSGTIAGREFEGQGSGVIVDKAGYIVTNYHVVEGTKTVQVRLSDRRTADATVVGTDSLTDIAVLKIDLDNLIAAEWGDSDALEVGDLVWALGSPYGLERTLTFGIVSAKSRHGANGSPYQEYLQTDAAVNPGNSGGPLVNIEGQIVGINAAIFGPAYQGISFSIPSALAKEKYEQLRASGHIERAWLGVAPLDVPDELREKLGLAIGQGVLVGVVEKNTPAERSGMRPGDVILKWNNHNATDPTLLSRTIAATKIGSTAKVVLVRQKGDGKVQVSLDVPVERRPADDER
ncbi:MAG TPA: trypsin-like peptidase domain-containing protein, partial [Lacipirellulaceae bacterium]|nr:trypsin-like peptidase domain-containing protein [Lacipirellulaceae bacterium]